MDEVYVELQPLMFSIAYRMLGSATEAEDIVQEAFLRFHRETSGGTHVDSAKAYLSTVTTRLSIDHLRSARVRRESYVGTWLPEPLLTEEEDDVVRHAETADSLSMGFLVLLESLTPVERAVFLLREVFVYGFDEIAPDRRQDRGELPPDLRAGPQARPRREATVRGVERAQGGARAQVLRGGGRRSTLDGLVGMLAADAVAYADGGGLAPATRHPVHGGEKVARLLLGASQVGRRLGVVGMRPVEINGEPGCVFEDGDGRAVAVVALDIADDEIQTIHAISNPEKLRHLGR